LRPRAYLVSRTLGLRPERLLKMLCVNSRLGALRPSHRRSLCSVPLDELPFSRASGEGEEPRAFGNVSASRLGVSNGRCRWFRRDAGRLRTLRLLLVFLFTILCPLLGTRGPYACLERSKGQSKSDGWEPRWFTACGRNKNNVREIPYRSPRRNLAPIFSPLLHISI
jgi:hypothetical protein